jgi:hypothetical protein
MDAHLEGGTAAAPTWKGRSLTRVRSGLLGSTGAQPDSSWRAGTPQTVHHRRHERGGLGRKNQP